MSHIKGLNSHYSMQLTLLWNKRGIQNIGHHLNIETRKMLTILEPSLKYPNISFSFFPYIQAHSYI